MSIKTSVQGKLLSVTVGALGAVILAALGGFGVLWNSVNIFDQTVHSSVAQERAVLDMTILFKEQVQEWKNVLLRGKDPKALDKYWTSFTEKEAAIEKAGTQLMEEIAEPKAKGMVGEFLKAHKEMGAAYRRGLQAYKDAGGDSNAGDTAVKGMDRAPTELLEKAAKEIQANAEAALGDGFSVARRAILVGAGVMLVVLVLALTGLVWLVRRAITQPLALAVKSIEGLSRGVLPGALESKSQDEIGRLVDAVRRMGETFKRFAQMQTEMTRKHSELGQIDHVMPEGEFEGVYGEMAKSVNELARCHIDVTLKVVATVKHYAEGDLSVDMERLPGKQAQFTEAVAGVKVSLKAINAQIAQLVEAAVRGDFTVRGEVDKYQHDFRKMVEALNSLMQMADKGLNEVSRVLGALAKGDLTEKISGDYQGTWAQMKNDANATVGKLTEIVGQIKEATETINVASKEIASGNSDLSSRTEEQASSLEETASSMEELTGTVKQNADNARQANQLVAGASEVAVKGGAVVRQVVQTMGGISESSKKIADIIGVIDGIAFQTNILALNAAVEAARAGEQGRGFAVVASEVRNLAQRSAAAAKEIKELITDSVSKVEGGTRLVDEAGKTMDEVVVSVKRVTDIMSEITAASQEQSDGIEQVNTAITQMDEVTQQNAALVEEAAAAAESMEEQAKHLANTVATFKLAQETIVAHHIVERRGADRAKNVARLPARGEAPGNKPAARAVKAKAAGGGDVEWKEF